MSPPAREGELLLNLGSVHHAMGEWDLAKAHYRQCLELEPDNPVVMDNMKLLGSQLYELKNHWSCKMDQSPGLWTALLVRDSAEEIHSFQEYCK